MRFPTDITPPNQRRLAENDALVELIQTTEYLEDTPTWGQRDYWLYPLGIMTLSIEEEGEVEEEGNGQVKDHLKENQIEGLEEVSPMGTEEEMEETHISQLLKEIKGIDRRKNGLYQQVLEEEKTFWQGENHCIGPPLLSPPWRIDFLQIGVVWDLLT